MKLVSDLYNKAASFNQNEKGTILPTAAIMITALGLAAGAAVDYSRYAKAKTLMDTALDAAILDAGARLGQGQPVDDKFKDDFNAFFNANIVGRGGFTDNFEIVSFSADETTGKVDATAAASVNTTLMRIGGLETMDVSSTSGGIFERNDTEVTIMLDVTGSMSGSKINALRSAASEAIDILLPNGTSTRNTRVGIVPYASSINAHRYAKRATQGNNTTLVASTGAFINHNNNVPTNKCVTDRGGLEAATNVSYKTAPVGSDKRSIQNSVRDLRCPNSKILPLTNDASELKMEIGNLQAAGFTAGSLGIAWSYYMLSPQWNKLWNNPNHEAAAFSNDVTKVAILMTDGVFNTAYANISDNAVAKNGQVRGPFASVDALNSSQNISAELCENMKNDGITVYTIGFDLDGIPGANARNNAINLLDNCATDDTSGQIFFYRAENETELRQTFQSIAKDITSLRLTN